MRGFGMSLVAALLALCAWSQDEGLDALLRDESVWKRTPAAFMGDYQAVGFAFTDGEKMARVVRPVSRFLGFRVWEASVNFEGDALARAELSLYNKGDAGDLDQETFSALLAKICEAINAQTGSKGMSGKTSNDRPNYYVNRRLWTKGSVGIQVEWAFVNPHRTGSQSVPFRAEFVKVMLAPLRGGRWAPQAGGAPTWANNATARTVKANVRNAPNGDVWVDNVPMVDQGHKGYCAAASAERLLRYYGRSVDQHEIAQLADTAAQGGTSLEGMVGALRTVGKKYLLDQKDLIRPDEGREFEKSKFCEMIEQYNRQARQRKLASISYMDYTEAVGPNAYMVDTLKIYAAMDAGALRDARVRQSQGLDGFKKDIVQYTTQGVPLVWACIVGKYPEKPSIGREGAFGHIRLIIGYNAKTQEVLYTDSWGPGHEMKRLPLETAWTMTFGLAVLKPRDVR